MLRTAIFAL